MNLKKILGNIGENKLLLITAIKIVDDYFDLNKKIIKKMILKNYQSNLKNLDHWQLIIKMRKRKKLKN